MLTSATGILTLLFLLIAVVLPLRLSWIEKTVASLPQAFRMHHVAGLATIAFGLIHATAAMTPYLSGLGGLGEALVLLFDLSDPLTLTGSIALTLLIATSLGSFLAFFTRRVWLWIHRLSIFGFVIAIAHAFIHWQNIAPFLSFFGGCVRLMLGMATVATTVALALHFIRPELLAQHHKFVVSKVTQLESGTLELALQLSRGSESWQSGEFGFFYFNCLGPCGVSRERHPFTVAKVADQGLMHIVVKAVGDDTQKLQKIEKGTCGEVTGPYRGLDALLSDASPQIWIAGGIGIMPFLGLCARIAGSASQNTNITLVYLFRPERTPLFLNELKQITAAYPQFSLIALKSDQTNSVDIEAIKRLAPDWKSRKFALSGPHQMVKYWTSALRAHGVRLSHIYSEDFLK